MPTIPTQFVSFLIIMCDVPRWNAETEPKMKLKLTLNISDYPNNTISVMGPGHPLGII